MKFSDVLDIRNGRNQRQVENANGKYPIYGSGGVMGRATDFICDAGTVVIGRKGSINNPIFVDEPFWNVDTAFGLVAHRDVLLPKYLFYFCVNFDFERLNTTVTIPSLTKANLLQIEINVPDMDEQRHVVSVLDKICRLTDLQQQELHKLDQIVKSRFIELFGDPVRNSMGLPTEPMTTVCAIIDGDRGKNYPKQDEFSDAGYCLFLNAKNVTATGFSFENRMFITKEKDNALHNGKLERGDVVLTTRGTLGNLAFYDDSVPFENVRINSGMVILRMKKSVMTEVFFMEQFKLQLQSIKGKIASGSAQPQLPISTMNKIRILLAPMALQEQFAAFVEQTDKSKLAVQKGLQELEILKKSLMQQYFG